MTHEHSPEQGMHGIEAVAHFLQRMQAPYQLIEHQDTFAAVDEARAMGAHSSAQQRRCCSTITAAFVPS
jgi:hypothetical protein